MPWISEISQCFIDQRSANRYGFPELGSNARAVSHPRVSVSQGYVALFAMFAYSSRNHFSYSKCSLFVIGGNGFCSFLFLCTKCNSAALSAPVTYSSFAVYLSKDRTKGARVRAIPRDAGNMCFRHQVQTVGTRSTRLTNYWAILPNTLVVFNPKRFKCLVKLLPNWVGRTNQRPEPEETRDVTRE
ncbi:uncharacterized protein EI97DRAFT_284873 [Westerdykella ornata]|uniref:Uncharacterized protein n=1 Tax=Westerdykella ornata TaxID=318751 RepID=A0A6A6J5H6_WESOR|nr:uncharacterized protein EI97DRAFT_284873 [Westerdykella ornata]KAF2271393.1 hypothetical protein EI97DRAFT_284873 [Westerdykella ornata]